MVEGVGTAMYFTASYTQLTQFYPSKKATIVVSGSVKLPPGLPLFFLPIIVFNLHNTVPWYLSILVKLLMLILAKEC